MQFAPLDAEKQGQNRDFRLGTSESVSLTSARVVPKSLGAPQCFDFDSYFFV
jgi:hypothetical protein